VGEGCDRASIVAFAFDLLYIDDADLIQEPLYMGDEKGLLEIIQTGALNFIQGERL